MIKSRGVIATLPRTQRGMPLVLGGDPKGKKFLYTNGNSVVIRDIQEPSICDIYTEHSFQTTVAKYSPSGFYICSGDVTGKIRIWDTVGEEHILKAEYQPFVGVIKDIAWSHDSQRLLVCGEGREKFGHVINMETGTSLGEVIGHSKTINTCDFRPKRPFKLITGSDDNLVGVYEGPPFKFKTQLEDHQKYVQCVRFSPDGNLFASGGFDGKLIVYKADNNEKLLEVSQHKGGIYGLSWSPDSSQVLTASGDRTAKIFDVQSQQSVHSVEMGGDVLDQQVGCLWQDKHLLSVSLSGFINYLSAQEEKPIRTVKGHNKPITALTVVNNEILSGACDGNIFRYNLEKKEGGMVNEGRGHKNQVSDLFLSSNKDLLFSLGFDDKLKAVRVDQEEFVGEVSLDSQPKQGVVSPNKQLILIACYDCIVIVDQVTLEIKKRVAINYEATCIARSENQETGEEVVAVGGKDKKVHIYSLTGGATLEEKTTLTQRDIVTCLRVSPDGKLLASGDANRKIYVYCIWEEFRSRIGVEWGSHQATVNAIAWNEDSKRLVSGSLDTALIVWNVEEPLKNIQLRKAHPLSQVTRVEWDKEAIISSGQDSNIKLWTLC